MTTPAAAPPGMESATTEEALVSPQRLREALGRFATGVTIVTCLDPELGRVGLTANSFNALSLEPPLVLWSLRRQSAQMLAFARAEHFVVNVLAEDQLALSRRFASRRDDKFDEGDWLPGEGGAPVLAGCTAVFECETFSRQDAGDHVLFIGHVLALAQTALPPLAYHAGHYHGLGGAL